MAEVMLWPGMALTLPSLPYLPMRGPSTRTPARAAQAPAEWTTVEPAKSQKPSLAEPAAAPDPVADDRVDERDEQEREDDEATGT